MSANHDPRFDLLVRSVKDYAIFMLDPAGTVVTWNEGARRLKGYEPEEIIGRHFSTFYVPEEAAAGKPARELEIALATGKYEEEGERVRKDGTRFWAHVLITRVTDARGSLVGFAKVTRDVSERLRQERRMKSRALQETSVAQLGVFALSTGELQPVMNRASAVVTESLGADFCEVLQLVEEGTLLQRRAGNGWPEVDDVLVPRDSRTQVAWTLGTDAVVVDDYQLHPEIERTPLMESLQIRSGISAVIRAGGREPRAYGVIAAYSRRAHSFSAEMVDFVRTVANVVATAIVRRESEEHLRSAVRAAEAERIQREQAEEQLRERDEFLSVAAHELRTPLTPLRLQLESLLARAGDEGNRERLQRALRNADRLRVLVERLLDLSRLRTGKFELLLEQVDLKDISSEVLEMLRPEAQRAETELRLTVNGDVSGNWDGARLEQVLTNLLTNALRYGGGKPVEVRLTRQEPWVILEVEDRGLGIAEADLERVFERFERAVSSNHFGGFGLGLYIVRQIVEAHGGSVQLRSKVGEGSVFTLRLPRTPSA